jgi:predicted ATP-binding protein involved in virulence
MKLKSIELLNFRGVAKMNLDFTERTTALVGVNGVGKSTVLDALAIALSHLTWRINEQPLKARPIAIDDIRIGSDFARISIAVELRQEDVRWSIAVNRRKGTYADPMRKSDLEALNSAIARLHEDWSHVEEDRQQPYDLPLAVYYDVNRAVLDIPLRVREKIRNTAREAYADALDHGGADFKRFFIWFRDREDYENEQRRESVEFRDPALQAVRSAIEFFTGFSNLRIQRKPLLRMSISKQALEFNVGQLSDGERNMLALVGDLSRRLSILSRSLANSNEGVGVVLIDEIDLHLHPKWQRTVMADLERTFPNCQFVVTTHSPQVVGELAAESVMLLRDGALLGHAERSLGLSSSEVLEEIMGVTARNFDVDNALTALRKLIDNDDVPKAQTELDEIRAKVGEIPDVLQAQSAIRSLELSADAEE